MRRMLMSMVTAVALVVTAVPLYAHRTVVSPFTFSKDVVPILKSKCASCHANFLDYETARAFPFGWQRTLLAGITTPSLSDAVAARPAHRALSMIEFDTLITWASGGTPEPGMPKPHAPHVSAAGGMVIPVAIDSMHLEVVFSEQRRLRVFATDVAGDPLEASKLQSLQVRVEYSGGVAPLVASKDGAFLEARIDSVTLPVQFTMVLKASTTSAEERTGLVFATYSVERPELALTPTVIPSSDSGIRGAILEQTQKAEQLLAAAKADELYVPTTHLRNLVLARGAQSSGDAATDAMRAIWLAHLAGDNGTPAEMRAAVIELRRAIDAYFK